MATKTITIKAGDTEPIDFTVSATGLSDLSALSSAVFYARATGSTTNEVDGSTAVTTVSSTGLKLRFDPATAGSTGGAAFTAAGSYKCYTKITWSDGDLTRHPGNGHLTIEVQAHYE